MNRSVIAAAVAIALSSLDARSQQALPVNALPAGGRVAAGQATISQSGAAMIIQQATARAALDWQSFNIGGNASVVFNQPSASAIALNRVLGADPSQIFGRLSSNGQVFLTNPNGILFGRGAQVDVGGILASTLSMSVDDFMSGRYLLRGDGGNGAITNYGTLRSLPKGYVALISPQVVNEGTIEAARGTAALVGANAATVDFMADGLIRIRVDEGALNAEIANKGAIRANGGEVLLTAKALGSLGRAVVNNSGVVEARTAENVNGVIRLGGGEVFVAGTLDASSDTGRGGSIKVLGDRVALTGNARLDASGELGGGEILVGGNYQGKGPEQNASRTFVGRDVSIDASAKTVGDGGRIIVWSNERTDFYGSIAARGGSESGNGGLVETSGKLSLSAQGSVDASAPHGQAGQWLLDPLNVTVSNNVDANPGSWTGTFSASATGSNVNAGTIQSALIGGTSVTVTTGSTGGETGDITVFGTADSGGAVNINKTSGAAATLTLQAAGSILMNPGATIQSSSGISLGVTLNTRNDNGSVPSNGAIVLDGASILVNNGDITLGGGATPSSVAAVGTLANPTGVSIINSTLANFGTSGNMVINGQGRTGSDAGVLIQDSSVTTVGAMTINATGNLNVFANSSSAFVGSTGTGTMTINATGLNVQAGSSGTGRSATIQSGGPQLITVDVGGLTLQGGSGTATNSTAQINKFGATADSQGITVNGGGSIVITGGAGSGGGNNAQIFNQGSLGQSVTLNGGGNLTITGGATGSNNSAKIQSTLGTQTIATTGTITLTGGGSGDGTGDGANIFQTGSGLQHVTANGIQITADGGTTGSANTSAIQTTTGSTASQLIDVGVGGITMHAGTGSGGGNKAGIYLLADFNAPSNATIATQVVNVTGAGGIHITGGDNAANFPAPPGSGNQNNASIYADAHGAGSSQTINVVGTGSIVLTGGASGIANHAGIESNTPSQIVSVGSGGITLNGGGGTSGANNQGRINELLTIVGVTPVASTQSVVVGNGGSISINGGTGTGGSNVGQILNNASGAQTITFTGPGSAINLLGGTGNVDGNTAGGGNSALIDAALGSQLITGSVLANDPAITITGGPSGGNFLNTVPPLPNVGHSALIRARVGTQTIDAGAIQVFSGATGVDNSGTIQAAALQTITASSVLIQGVGSSGNFGGARIGGIGGTSPGPTNLQLTTTGDITVSGGSVSGAAIGTSGIGGGAATAITIVSTGGKVTLNDGTGNGARIGSPSTSMGGGNISVTAAGNIALNAVNGFGTQINTTGNVELHADSAGKSISEGTNSIVRANTLTATANAGITLNGNNLVTNFNATNTATGGIQFTQAAGNLLTLTGISQSGGNVVITADDLNITNPVNAGASSVTLRPTAPSQNINLESSPTGGLSLSPSDLGFVTASTLDIGRSDNNSTGTMTITAFPLNTQANAGTYRLFAQDINYAGGIGSTGAEFPRNLELRAANNLTTSNSTILLADGANLTLVADNDNSGAGDLTISNSLNTLGQDRTILAGTTAGNTATMLLQGRNVSATDIVGTTMTVILRGSGTQTVSTPGTLTVQGGGIQADEGTQVVDAQGISVFASGTFAHLSAGTQNITAGSGGIIVQGGAGTGNNAGISTQTGTQTITVNGGNLTLQGGSGPSNNFAQIDSSGTAQTITVNGGNVQLNSVANGGAAIRYQGSNASLLSIAAKSINLSADSQISTTSGSISLVADNPGPGSAVFLANASSLSSGNGDISVTGTAHGAGAGVFMGGNINAGNGNITINGTGGTASDATNVVGVLNPFGSNPSISAGGTVSITGHGGTSTGTGSAQGVGLANAHVDAEGSVVITGFGGVSPTQGAAGVIISNLSDIGSSSNLTITGTGGSAGGSSGGSAVGVIVGSGSDTLATGVHVSAMGLVTITGTGGTGTNTSASGLVTNFATIESIGGISITGTAGTGSTSTNASASGTGVALLLGTTLQTALAGNIAIDGTARTGAGTGNATGVGIADGTVIQTIGIDIPELGGFQVGSGSITIVGRGGGYLGVGTGPSGTGSANGVSMGTISTVDAGQIKSNTGDITITGYGGLAANGEARGFVARSSTGVASLLESFGGGAISITGTGGTANATGTNTVTGVGFGAATARTAGTLTLNGTGGINTGGANTNGVGMSDGALITTTGSGTLSITGVGGTSSGGSTHGITVNPFTTSQGATVTANAALVLNGTVGSNGASSAINIGDSSVSSSNGSVSATATGNISLTAVNAPAKLDAQGNETVSATGTINLQGGSATNAWAEIASFNGSQTVTAGGISLTGGSAVGGGSGAFLSIFGGTGAQNITVNGGNVAVLGGTNATTNQAGIDSQGLSQNLALNNSALLSVVGQASGAVISSSGNQTISLTGTGNNAIQVGNAASAAISQIMGNNQSVTAGTGLQNGSITLTGAAADNTSVFLNSNSGTQTVSTTGALNLIGGTAPVNGFSTSIYNNGASLQHVSANSISLVGGASGTNNGVFISTNGSSTGSQTIDVGSGGLTLTGGAGAGGGNGVNIGQNSATGAQTIHVTGNGNISITGGANGNNNSAGIYSSGTSQLLDLSTGGNLILQGGSSGTNNGSFVSQGGSGSQTLLANTGTGISISGGSGTATSSGSSISNNAGSGDQIINAGSGGITINGSSSSGSNNTAAISTFNATGVQHITSSSIAIGGATAGANNGAGIFTSTSSGAQTLDVGAGGLTVTGSSGAGGGNWVNIGQISTTAPQTINVTGGGGVQIVGGTNGAGNNAGIYNNGTSQLLNLFAGGNLTLQGGSSGANNGVFISQNNATGTQTVTVNGGSVSLLGGTGATNNSASIGNSGTSQSIAVNDAASVSIVAQTSSAGISSSHSQTVTIQGNASANALTIGSPTSAERSNIVGQSQSVTVGTGVQAGSITIYGGVTAARSAGIFNNAGDQQVSTTGTITLTGGTAPFITGETGCGNAGSCAQIGNNSPSGVTQTISAHAISALGGISGDFNVAGVYNSGSGLQTVTINGTGGSIQLQGGSSAGRMNSTYISGGTSDELINFAAAGGSIVLQGGTGGTGNSAGIGSGTMLNQTISGRPSITMTGGANGGIVDEANYVSIGTGSAGSQNLTLGPVLMNAGAGGTQNFASMTSLTQTIDIAGSLTLNGYGSATNGGARIGGRGVYAGSAETATNLTLTTSGDITLTGGSLSGAAIGSATTGTAQNNNISINANGGGNIVLTSGSGSVARIGAPSGLVAGGNISVNTTGDLSMTGNAANTPTIQTNGNIALGATNNISLQDATVNAGGTLNVAATSDLMITANSAASGLVSNGLQTISAAGISLQGANAGTGINASITSNAGQLIDAGVDGISLTAGGGTATNNRAQIDKIGTTGSQSVVVNDGGAITLTGGAGSGGGNRAEIYGQGTGGQSINFNAGGSIAVTGGTVGVNNTAKIQSENGNQVIGGATSIALTGGASGGGIGVGNGAFIQSGGSITTVQGNQIISVGSGGLSLTGGGGALTGNYASIFQPGLAGTSQTITVNGGGAIVLHGGSSAQSGIGSATAGSYAFVVADGDSQLISFTSGGAINVTGGTVGSRNTAGIWARNGAQTVSGAPDITLTGGASGGLLNEGNNASLQTSLGLQTITANNVLIQGGSAGAANSARIVNFASGGQNVTASGITLIGGADGGGLNTGNFAQIISTTGSQSITVGSGGLHLTGGSGSLTQNFASVFQGGLASTTQAVTVNGGGSILLQGGSSAQSGIGATTSGSYAFIIGDGDSQTINFTAGGAINATGGSVGSRNNAGIQARNGTMTISGSPNITLTGGPTGGFDQEGNIAILQSNVGSQTIDAGNVTLHAGAGGINNGVSIGGPSQNITVHGDLSLTGGGSVAGPVNGGGAGIGGRGGLTPTVTNLTLNVDGNVTLNGGSAVNSGSAIGSSFLGGQTTDITMTVGGDVTLTPGTAAGARIGSPASAVAGGYISVTAGGNIALNSANGVGSAIRTLGDVELHANSAGKSITEALNSIIQANALTTTSDAGTGLAGTANAVSSFSATNTTSGNISLTNTAAPLTISGISESGSGSVTVNNTGAVNINGPVSASAGDVTIAGSGPLTLNSTVSASGVAALLQLIGSSFVNNFGSSALSAPSGRWLVWSGDPLIDVTGGLSFDFKQYAATYGLTAPAQSSGDGLLYSVVPTASTINLTGSVSRQYDGTTAAPLTPGNFTAPTVFAGDVATIGYTTANYDDKNAGSGKTVTANGLGVIATSGGKPVYGYQLTNNSASGVIGTISTAPLTVTAQTDSRGYNGTVSSGVAPLVSGTLYDSIGTAATQSYDNKNVGTTHVLSASGLVVSDGNSGNNYAISYVPSAATGVISAAPLTISAATDSRQYNGTTGSAGTPTVSSGTVYGSDNLTGLSQSFASKNVLGANASTLSVAGYTLNDGNSGNNYAVTLNSAAGTITTAPLTISAATDSRQYNGTTGSAGTPTVTSGTVYGSDNLTGLSQSFASKNVLGANGSTLIAGYTLNDGNSGNNYAVTLNSAAGTITTAPLTISAATDSRQYNGTTGSAGTPTVTSGTVYGSDNLTGLSQSFASKNVLGANGSTLIAGYTLNDGNSGNNYAVTLNSAAGTISTAPLTVTAQTDSRGYNGTVSSGVAPLVSGTLYDSIGTAATQSYDNKNVGTTHVLSASGLVVSDGNSGNNYAISYVPSAATGVISAAPLTISAATDSRQYNGTTGSAGTPTVSSGTVYGSDNLTGLSQSFASKNVLGANASTLSVAGYTLNDGNSGNNYAVTLNSAAGTITTAPLTISAATDSRQYNGTTGSAGTPTVTSGTVYGSDNLTGLSQAYASKNVLGANGSTLIAGYTLNDGNSGNNYAVTLNSAAGTITTAPLTISAATDSRQYNGTTGSAGTPTVTSGTVYGSDNLTGLSQSFASKNVLGANGSTLIAGYTLNDGNSGNNYAVTLNSAAGTISTAPLTVTAQTDSRGYNGTVSSGVAPLVSGTLYDSIGTAATQSYDNKNVGTTHVLSASGLVVSDGNSGNNYAISYVPSAATGVISAAPLTISAATDSRQYNGTTGSAGTPTVSSGTVYGSDNLTGLSQSFASKNVLGANASTLSVAGYTLNDGNSGNNYAVTLNSAAGTITTAPLTISAATDSRQYNGTTGSAGTPTVTSGTVYGSDNLTGLSQSFASKNVLGANGSTLIAGYTLNDGNSGNNYAVTLNSAAGTITTAPLTISAATDSRQYNGTTGSAGTPTVTSGTVYGSDNLTGLSQSFASKNVLGANGSTLIAGYTLNDGNSGNNYAVTLNSAAGTISTAPLTISAATDSRQYNGTTGSAGTPTVTSGTVYGSDNLTGLSQSFASKNVLGANGSTLIAGYTLNDGNGGNNYAVTLNSAAGTITPLALTGATIASGSSTYASALAPGAVSFGNLVSGDSVSSAASVNTSTLSGAGKPIVGAYTQTASAALTGSDAGNYSFGGFTSAANYTITPLALTISGITAANKTYDGNNSATVSTAGALYTGLVGGDAVAVNATGAFIDKNVAVGKTVNLASGYAGADVGNYSITDQATTTANITRLASVTASASGNWSSAGTWTGGAIPDMANVANVVIPSGKTVTFDNAVPALAGAVQVDGINSAGTLAVNSGTLTVAGLVGTSGYTQSGGITNAASFIASNSYNQTGGTLNVPGAVSIANTGVLALGNINGGSLAVANTGGAIGQTAGSALIIQGMTSISAGADPITLTQPNNDFMGQVTLSNSGAGNAVSITDVNNIAFTAMNLGGDFTVTAGGGAGQISLHDTTNSGTQTYNGNVVLNSTETSNGAFTITGGLTVGSNSVINSNTGNVTVGGAVLDPGGTTLTINAGTGAISLTNAGNNLTGALSLTGGNTSVTNSGLLTFGTSNIAGNLAVTSNGIAQIGPLAIAGAAILQAGSGLITLTDPSNSFLGGVTALGGGVNIPALNPSAAAVVVAASAAVTSAVTTATSSTASTTTSTTTNAPASNVGFSSSLAPSAAAPVFTIAPASSPVSSAPAAAPTASASTAPASNSPTSSSASSPAASTAPDTGGTTSTGGGTASTGSSAPAAETGGGTSVAASSTPTSTPAADTGGGTSVASTGSSGTSSGSSAGTGSSSSSGASSSSSSSSGESSSSSSSGSGSSGSGGQRSQQASTSQQRGGQGRGSGSSSAAASAIRAQMETNMVQLHAQKMHAVEKAVRLLEQDPTIADLKPCGGGGGGGDCIAVRAPGSPPQSVDGRALSAPKVSYLPAIERKVALLIGVSDYEGTIPKLSSPVNDVQEIGKIMKDQLGYEVRTLPNADKATIVRELNRLILESGSNDSVTVMYAGHGHLVEKTQRGYWIPAKASADDPKQWISNQDIARALENIPAKQIMLVSDSCYSGSLTREAKIDKAEVLPSSQQVLERRSVTVLSSGGEEPVPDQGKDGHSVFAWHFMQQLKSVKDVSNGVNMFEQLSENVTADIPQTPQYGAGVSSGHQRGGDYLFEIRRFQ